MDTLRATGQIRQHQQTQPLFKAQQLKDSERLLDLLAGRMCPGRINFDNAADHTVAHVIIPASPRRVAIHFIGPNTGRVTISDNPSVTLDNGITIMNTTGILSLDSTTSGDVVTREWYAIGSAAGTILSWIEVYAPDNV